MARPTTTQTIAANADGHLVMWIDGELFGESELLTNVRRAADLRLATRFTRFGPQIIANLHESLGATAALLHAYPGRTTILEAPTAVLACFAHGIPSMHQPATGSRGVVYDV